MQKDVCLGCIECNQHLKNPSFELVVLKKLKCFWWWTAIGMPSCSLLRDVL